MVREFQTYKISLDSFLRFIQLFGPFEETNVCVAVSN